MFAAGLRKSVWQSRAGASTIGGYFLADPCLRLEPMRTAVAPLLAVVAAFSGAFALPAPAQEATDDKAAATITLTPAEAKAALEAAGFKVSTTGVSLPAENAFAARMKEIAVVRKSYLAADKELAAAENEAEQLKQGVTQLKTQHVQLSAALATAQNVAENNRIVGVLNALSGQMDLAMQQQEKLADKVKAARGKSSEAREVYTGKLLELRSVADKVEQTWSKAAADPKLQAAMAKAGEVLKKPLELKPTTVYNAAERQLSQYEDKILSENIRLRDDNDTLWASVVINGKHTKEMVVDSGANSVVLPYEMAREMGIEVQSTDQKIVVIIADGSRVPGTLKILPSVRVGKFVVEDVETVIMDKVAIKAVPLLGMSFLGKFKFEIDQAASILKMVKIDEEGSSPGKKK